MRKKKEEEKFKKSMFGTLIFVYMETICVWITSLEILVKVGLGKP